VSPADEKCTEGKGNGNAEAKKRSLSVRRERDRKISHTAWKKKASRVY